ncbi:hypothetical protein ACFOWA_19980 [Pedobacter lithocola]|uniref:Uncharacterized protein n=1 Tax=Pedobacter lithocola TaxID=1908239 RepID=A0ABV8PEL3_9SPHI
MKTGLEVVRDIRSLMNIPEITNNISGKIYDFWLPQNATGENVAISVLAIDNEKIQSSFVNVNIYAPNLKINLVNNTGIDNTQPNLLRFDFLANLIIPFLDSQFKYDFHTWVDSPPIPMRNTDGGWFLNIKVNYQHIQNNFKNI